MADSEQLGPSEGDPAERPREAGRARHALLANIRHELRTPLNAILGYSEILLEDATDPDLAGFVPDLRRIHAAGNELLALVNRILDPAKADAAGTVDLDAVGATMRRDLRTPMTAVVGYSEMLLEDAADQGQDLIVPDPQRIHGAAERFVALIDDVVAFARTHTDDLDATADGSGAAGMIREVVATLDRLETDAATRPMPGAGAPLLIVDDNETNREVLARHLERQGLRTVAAENGRRALELLGEQAVDLVLLDVMMPEMNGYQVLHHLKTDAALRDIPVIMISALDDLESVVRCIQMGAEDYLPKPFDPVLLRARVGALLERKRLRDVEVEYLRGVAQVTAAAAAIEAETFDPESLAEAATRPDELGQLARVFRRMAREVYAREQRLKQEVQQLRIEIDRARAADQVAEITETDYFRSLQEKARDLRSAARRGDEASGPRRGRR